MRLAPVLAIVLAACYSPDVRDCTVSCAAASECESGQVCGADGLCATPGVAGHCARGDGAAATAIALHVSVTGTGRVTVSAVGVCDSTDKVPGDCTWLIAPQITRTATASTGFDKWTSSTCSGQTATCTFTPVTTTELTAKFAKSE